MSNESEQRLNFNIETPTIDQLKKYRKYIPDIEEISSDALTLMIALFASEDGVVACKFTGVNSHIIAQQVIPELTNELTRAGVPISAGVYENADHKNGFVTTIMVGVHKSEDVFNE